MPSRIDCELPDGPKRYTEQNDGKWTDLERRFTRLEENFEELSSLVRKVLEQSSGSNSGVEMRRSEPAESVQGDSRSDGFAGENGSYVPQPVVLLRNLQSQFFGQKGDFTSESFLLGDIITRGIISPELAERLLPVFVISASYLRGFRLTSGRFAEHWGLWISLSKNTRLSVKLRETQPLLFSAACLLASRFVPEVSKSTIHEMYAQVRRLLASVLLNAPPLGYETLQALFLLSMWSPTVQTAVPIDSWLLSGVALNHAILSFDFIDGEGATDVNEDTFREMRIWNGLCVTQLQY